MPIYEAKSSPKIYALWKEAYQFGQTHLKFEEWVDVVYVEYKKVRVNIYA